MKKIFYLAALLGAALVFPSCADTPEFRSDTLENTRTSELSLGDRGSSACMTMREMELENLREGLKFPMVNASKERNQLISLSQKLVDRFVGQGAEKSTRPGVRTFRNGEKILKVDEEKYEISFINEGSYSDDGKITPEEVISEAKKFINSYKELGSTSDYYIAYYMGGIYSQSAGTDPDGTFHMTPVRQEAAEIRVNRVVKQIPILGGVGSIKFSLRPDRSVNSFKIKLFGLSVQDDYYSGTELIGYDDAEQRARKFLSGQYKDADSFQFTCEFGYIPETDETSSSKLVPGYLLLGYSPTSDSRALVVVPAISRLEPSYKPEPSVQ